MFPQLTSVMFIDSMIVFMLEPMSFPTIYDFLPNLRYLLYRSTNGAFVLQRTMSPSLTSSSGTSSKTLPALWSSFFSMEGTILCAYSTIESAHLYDILRGKHFVFGKFLSVFNESLSEPLNWYMSWFSSPTDTILVPILKHFKTNSLSALFMSWHSSTMM